MHVRARLGATAAAALAGVDEVIGHLHGRAARRLLERHLHLHPHVAALHAAGRAAAAEAPNGSPPKNASKMSAKEPKPWAAEAKPRESSPSNP